MGRRRKASSRRRGLNSGRFRGFMSVITGVALFIFGLLNLLSVVMDIVERNKVGSSGLKEPAAVYRRRLLLHLGVGVLIIGGFWAIVHFGPLRPVHEWLR